MPPLVTPTSFDICSLISNEVRGIGPLAGLDAKTLPDPVSVEALRTALAEAEERNASIRASARSPVPSKPSPAPAAPAGAVTSTPAPRKASRWAMYSLALGAALLMATLQLAVEPPPGVTAASPPRETGPAEATTAVTPPELAPVPLAAPVVTAPVVVAAVKEKPAALLVRRSVAQAPSPPPVAATVAPPPPVGQDESSTRAGKELAAALVPKALTTQPTAHAGAKVAKEDDSELAAAARLQRLAAQQVGASLGR